MSSKPLPAPLPPETRTVGQVVAEAIRLYGRSMWLALPLGLPVAVADVVSFGLSVGLRYNAFVLAARKVNPAFTITPVYISTWNDPAKEADTARAMIDQGIDVIAQHTDGPAALQVAEERGIVGGFGQGADMSAFAPKAHLTAIIDWWGPHYEQAAKAVIDGTWASGDRWPGLKEGEVVIGPYNPSIPADVVAAAEAVKNGQIDGSFHIFTGPIKDHTGTERVAAGVVMTDAELLSMDWYVEGVIPPA